MDPMVFQRRDNVFQANFREIWENLQQIQTDCQAKTNSLIGQLKTVTDQSNVDAKSEMDKLKVQHKEEIPVLGKEMAKRELQQNKNDLCEELKDTCFSCD